MTEITSAHPARATAALELNDDQFEKWAGSNDTIFLNTIPVRHDASSQSIGGTSDAGRGTANGAFQDFSERARAFCPAREELP